MITDAAEASFSIDLAVARNYIWALGGDGAILPDELEGAIFRVTMPQVAMLFYATQDNPDQGVRLLQTTSPTLATPSEIDMDAIRTELLESVHLASGIGRATAGSRRLGTDAALALGGRYV